ncbi:MAG: glycoside hydrolase family 31 protein [Verrucomicrobia bacterium]|nr:glycoside hydrolase family 31 protein [Verrucomicrobiota bacterium]
MFLARDGALLRTCCGERLLIEPWGMDALRVRSTMHPDFDPEHWALDAERPAGIADIHIADSEKSASIRNGNILAQIDARGQISYYNAAGDLLLAEYIRVRLGDMLAGDGQIDQQAVSYFNSALKIHPRAFTPQVGGDYSLSLRFESQPDEKIFGMGGYQHGFLDHKGCLLELAQRNSQASVPFAVSSLGYGFLWNNPAIGYVSFSKNLTEWTAYSTRQLDYWITAAPTPRRIVENYAKVTGTVPIMPEYGLGLWQSKLRYQTQDELLSVAREYWRRGIRLDVIVVDFFHWPKQGEYRFDPEYWPDPESMIAELEANGTKLMVSIWPTIDKTSMHFEDMRTRGLLVRTHRGIATTMDFLGDTVFFDATNPQARDYIWQLIKANYHDKGVRIFWLDEAEPEYSVYDWDNYRYHAGTDLQVGNIYPRAYAQGFYEGMSALQGADIVNLVRCAWAGSQKFGALVWSGDVDSSFESLRNQLAIGLNMGIAGIPWWTSDIGGFHGGVNTDPLFRECLVRWFQLAVFSPVLRMHGDREPHEEPLSDKGGGCCPSGAGNEIWSFGADVEAILVAHLRLREQLRPYLREQMRHANTHGTPLMRPLCYDFPEDKNAWQIEDAYMFGADILVAPVLHEGMRQRAVYLPADCNWQNHGTGEIIEGGRTVVAEAPLAQIPVFLRESSPVCKMLLR